MGVPAIIRVIVINGVTGVLGRHVQSLVDLGVYSTETEHVTRSRECAKGQTEKHRTVPPSHALCGMTGVTGSPALLHVDLPNNTETEHVTRARESAKGHTVKQGTVRPLSDAPCGMTGVTGSPALLHVDLVSVYNTEPDRAIPQR